MPLIDSDARFRLFRAAVGFTLMPENEPELRLVQRSLEPKVAR